MTSAFSRSVRSRIIYKSKAAYKTKMLNINRSRQPLKVLKNRVSPRLRMCMSGSMIYEVAAKTYTKENIPLGTRIRFHFMMKLTPIKLTVVGITNDKRNENATGTEQNMFCSILRSTVSIFMFYDIT